MILSSVLIAVAVGFVQGFVGIATTAGLARPLAALSQQILKLNIHFWILDSGHEYLD